jgi:hypothetical protein
MCKLIGILIVGCAILFIYHGCAGPEPTRQEFGTIDVTEDPIQIAVEYDTTIVVSDKKSEFTLSLIAYYKISGIVVCKKSFSMGWQSEFVPVDLSFCWGEIARPENTQYVTFIHKGRWYYFKVTKDSPFNHEYVYRHSSNNHIIPATKNILRAVKSIKINTPVILEGYLVDMTGTYDENTCWWSTSRVRTDTKQNSCELIYVNRVRIGNDVYE